MATAPNITSSVTQRKKSGGTDYDKWNKIDFKALGIDSDEDDSKKAARRRAEAEEVRDYKKQVEEQNKAQERLKELEIEKRKAELQLAEIESQKQWMDKILMGIGIVVGILMLMTAYWSYTGAR